MADTLISEIFVTGIYGIRYIWSKITGIRDIKTPSNGAFKVKAKLLVTNFFMCGRNPMVLVLIGVYTFSLFFVSCLFVCLSVCLFLFCSPFNRS